ncbi:hypothetical protein [Vreelandella olivaria]|uniref:hypothetical protein n=1 Tax=Vreelandella olivaria TaxID=390919 RepID=UPI00201EE074|nr:hypothetical protein [Halomonas olivaria]
MITTIANNSVSLKSPAKANRIARANPWPAWLLLGGIGVATGAMAGEVLATGSGMTTFTLRDTERHIDVYHYVPEGADAQTPTVFVLTGIRRNADEYRDAWVEAADQYNFTIVVPRFSPQDYPGVAGYNLGNLTTEDGEVNPPEEWSFSVIDALYSDLQEGGQTERESYYLFGHSAGCQFVHRMMTFVPESNAQATICSAAGWWTLPDTDNEWPYGLANSPVELGQDEQRQLFAHNLLVTVGDEDNDPWHRFLRRSYQAMAQGDHRVERAWGYYKTAEQQATRFDLDFNWVFQTVPEAGHDNAKVASFAAAQFDAFERTGAFDVTTPETAPNN